MYNQQDKSDKNLKKSIFLSKIFLSSSRNFIYDDILKI